MVPTWWKPISLLLVASLFITSCTSGFFAGSKGVQQAAIAALPKPPLAITASERPYPALGEDAGQLPLPPIRPFAVGTALFPELVVDPGLQALLLASAPPLAPTPLPVPTGPSFEWSKTENYLILGTDHRPEWTNWRTDSLIVVGVDRINNRVAVFSVPRDLYVQIPGYGWGRINQVDYIGERAEPNGGGPKLVSQVLQDNLGIATNHWVRMRMDGFIDVVDAVGGVTVRLDCPFYEPIFNLTTQSWDYFTLPAGDVWMDGDTAYWFVRLRLRESDIGRSRRQRQFLWALRDQVAQANLLARFPELWAAFQSTFTTDLNIFEMADLLAWGIGLEASNVRASGLSLFDLQNYTTAEGAQVLRIADPGRVRAIVDGVWAAPAMIDANRQDATTCPPLPPGAEFATASALPDPATTDPDALGAPPPGAEPPVEVVPPTEVPPAEPPPTEVSPAEPPPTEVSPAEPPPTEAPPAEPPPTAEPAPIVLPTPTPQPAASIFPTPTPAAVGLVGSPGDG